MPIHPSQLSELVDRFWPVLVAWVGWQHPFAEDIVQEAFIRLAAQEPTPTDFRAWLFTVTRRLSLNECRSQRRRKEREREYQQYPIVPDHASWTAEQAELHCHLRSLEPQELQVVLARVWGEMTFDEIAVMLGGSKATVWRTYVSAVEKLKDCYGVR